MNKLLRISFLALLLFARLDASSHHVEVPMPIPGSPPCGDCDGVSLGERVSYFVGFFNTEDFYEELKCNCRQLIQISSGLPDMHIEALNEIFPPSIRAALWICCGVPFQDCSDLTKGWLDSLIIYTILYRGHRESIIQAMHNDIAGRQILYPDPSLLPSGGDID